MIPWRDSLMSKCNASNMLQSEKLKDWAQPNSSACPFKCWWTSACSAHLGSNQFHICSCTFPLHQLKKTETSEGEWSQVEAISLPVCVWILTGDVAISCLWGGFELGSLQPLDSGWLSCVAKERLWHISKVGTRKWQLHWAEWVYANQPTCYTTSKLK